MMTYVYRLDITYPEGSDEYGWEPEGEWWQHQRGGYRQGPEDEFQWPAEHLYLSSSGANKRATMLRAWGATITVVRSLPVVWP